MRNVIVNTLFSLSVILLITAAGFSQDIKSVVTPGLLFETLALNKDLPTKTKPIYLSPTDLVASPDGDFLFVAEQTAKQIAVIDLSTDMVTKRIKLPNEVSGVVVSNDGTKLYATCSSEIWPAGYVHEIDIAAGKSVRSIPVGHSARCPVLSPDGDRLYVCNVFDDNISVIDVTIWNELERIEVVREPYSAAITPDGKTLVVGNSLPDGKSTDSTNLACKISLINTQDTDDIVHIPLLNDSLNGTHSVFGMDISNDGKYAFVTHLIGQFNIPATVITQGWIHSNNLSIIDLSKKVLLNCFTLDETSDDGAANPWDVECTDDDSFLCVAHAGSNEISIIDLPQLIEKANGPVFHQRDFAALYSTSIRRLVPVEGKAPRALEIVGDKVYTAGFFSETIEAFGISLSPPRPGETIALGSPQPLTSLRKGEFNFYAGSLCYNNWQSCHSCHPFTRPDAMNWILNESGGNQAPKNAKSMLYAWWTPPTNWTAKRENAYQSIRYGIRLELFREPSEEIAICIDTFFMNLKPVPSPYLVKGQLSPSAQRGKEIYHNTDKVDCIHCHSGPLFTDNSRVPQFISDPWDDDNTVTPHLIETWRTAPYDHLGSSTLEEVLKNPGHTNAGTHLNAEEFNDLMEYILSL